MKNLTENIINDLLKKQPDPFKIFFWGICKNAGKTTALLHTYAVVKKLSHRPTLILSCGFDGEVLDAITGLAKPQISIQKNDYCITTEKFVSENDFKIVFKENRNTVYGKPIIAKAKQTAKITIAAVGSNSDIQRIMKNESIPSDALYLIDGAINRKAFLELAEIDDYISISAGNSFSNDFELIRNEVLFIEELFNLPSNSNSRSDYRLLDSTIAATLHDTVVVLKNINHVFLNRNEYRLFKLNGNNIIFMEQPPQLLWATFNPFNANENKVEQDYTSILNQSMKTISVINLIKEPV